MLQQPGPMTTRVRRCFAGQSPECYHQGSLAQADYTELPDPGHDEGMLGQWQRSLPSSRRNRTLKSKWYTSAYSYLGHFTFRSGPTRSTGHFDAEKRKSNRDQSLALVAFAGCPRPMRRPDCTHCPKLQYYLPKLFFSFATSTVPTLHSHLVFGGSHK